MFGVTLNSSRNADQVADHADLEMTIRGPSQDAAQSIGSQTTENPAARSGLKRFLGLTAAAVALTGGAAGVATALINRKNKASGQDLSKSRAQSCITPADQSSKGRLHGAYIHYLQDSPQHTKPTRLQSKTAQQAFDHEKGLNALFATCDQNSTEPIRFKLMATYDVDASNWTLSSYKPEEIDFTQPYGTSYSSRNPESYNYNSNLISRFDPQNHYLHLVIARDAYTDGSVSTDQIGGFAYPGNNYQVYGLSWIGRRMTEDNQFMQSVFAHEMGHNFDLLHTSDPSNVMYHASGGSSFTPAQCQTMLEHLQKSTLLNLCNADEMPQTLQPLSEMTPYKGN